MFVVGGTDVNIHKYLGPLNPEEAQATADQPVYDKMSVTNIQDLLFLENRDRKYDPDIYNIRGIYNVQDIDFDLSAFGMFLSNDTVFLTVHINSSVKTLGRKILSGDVIELPHLKDEYALNDYSSSLKRFYVVEDVTRAGEGFSPTWFPHLYRLKLKQIIDSQEYADILDQPADLDSDNTLRDLLSTYDKEMQISQAVVAQAEADAPRSGFEISHYYTIDTNENGSISLRTAVPSDLQDNNISEYAAFVGKPSRSGYTGYMIGGGDAAPNGLPFGIGTQFPRDTVTGDYFLRTDFMPNRLFQYDEDRWKKVYDDIRMTLSNVDQRQNQRGSFVNNFNTSIIDGEIVEERQSLSKALRPKPDN